MDATASGIEGEVSGIREESECVERDEGRGERVEKLETE